jgi:hypothetical protein
MPSKEVYSQLLKVGIRVDNCHYCKYDSLATEDDLSKLFDVLTSVKDKNGNPAVITANAIVANPDFQRIKDSNFTTYFYKRITDSFLEYKGCERVMEVWKQGQSAGCYNIQSHGREHLNVSRWMQYLRNDSRETRQAFNLGVFGLSTTISSEKRKSFLPAFDFDTAEEEQSVNQIAKEGLEIFNEIFGYKPKSFIAPNYIWGQSLEQTLKVCGIDYIQGTRIHRYTELQGQRSKRRFRYTGKKNVYGQIDLVRNAQFEPSENSNKDWVNSCLTDINDAFRWRHPAIICSHRVNFIGSLDQNNRNANLILLKNLLKAIINKWPNVEFMSSNQLGELITRK